MSKQVIYFLLGAAFLLVTGCQKDDDPDKSKPFIKVIGSDPLYWGQGNSPYIDPGVEAWDVTETNDTINITHRLSIIEDIDVDETGDYDVRFNVTDEAGNQAAEKTRVVKVVLTK